MALVTAVPYERRPLRMRYSLTEPGRRLGAAIATLAEWGAGREGRGAGAGPRRVRLAARDPPVVPDVRPGRRPTARPRPDPGADRRATNRFSDAVVPGGQFL